MLALRKTLAQPGGLSVDDIEPPAAPGPGQVRVRVLRAGICGTDLHGTEDHEGALPALISSRRLGR